MNNMITKNLTILCFLVFTAEILLCLYQVLFPTFPQELFIKFSFTNAALFLFFFVIHFMIKENRYKNKISLACFTLFSIGLLLSLTQLWITCIRADLFVKIQLTDGAIFVILFVANFLIKENKLTESINDGSKLDD